MLRAWPGKQPRHIERSPYLYAGAVVPHRVVGLVFVGRSEGLTKLAAALDAAVEQGPAVAMVTGEAGIGKSRLLAEFTR
jgi:hypothetical protein